MTRAARQIERPPVKRTRQGHAREVPVGERAPSVGTCCGHGVNVAVDAREQDGAPPHDDLDHPTRREVLERQRVHPPGLLDPGPTMTEIRGGLDRRRRSCVWTTPQRAAKPRPEPIGATQ